MEDSTKSCHMPFIVSDGIRRPRAGFTPRAFYDRAIRMTFFRHTSRRQRIESLGYIASLMCHSAATCLATYFGCPPRRDTLIVKSRSPFQPSSDPNVVMLMHNVMSNARFRSETTTSWHVNVTDKQTRQSWLACDARKRR